MTSKLAESDSLDTADLLTNCVKNHAKCFWACLMSKSAVSNTSMLLFTSFGHSQFTCRLWNLNLKQKLRLKGLTLTYDVSCPNDNNTHISSLPANVSQNLVLVRQDPKL